MPQMPPATASSVLSVSSCCTRRLPAGAERQPHGGFALPARGAREQQVGDVRARDQQDDAGDAELDAHDAVTAGPPPVGARHSS